MTGTPQAELQYESKTSPGISAPPAASVGLEQLARARNPVPLAYVTPETSASGPPGYREILVMSARVRTVAKVIGGIGWVVLGFGVIVFFERVLAGRSIWYLVGDVWELTPGAALIIVSLCLRLLAATAVAVRDIARNSFRDGAGRGTVNPSGNTPALP
jgi:hypothetical protein